MLKIEAIDINELQSLIDGDYVHNAVDRSEFQDKVDLEFRGGSDKWDSDKFDFTEPKTLNFDLRPEGLTLEKLASIVRKSMRSIIRNMNVDNEIHIGIVYENKFSAQVMRLSDHKRIASVVYHPMTGMEFDIDIQSDCDDIRVNMSVTYRLIKSKC